MKKLNFKEFSIPTGISRKSHQIVDAREPFADLLYTRISGIKSLHLALKIYESEGETEYSDEETELIRRAVESYCLPNVIDAFSTMLDKQEPDKNE